MVGTTPGITIPGTTILGTTIATGAGMAAGTGIMDGTALGTITTTGDGEYITPGTVHTTILMADGGAALCTDEAAVAVVAMQWPE